MWKLVQKLKDQPEPVRKRIFIVSLAGMFIFTFTLYVFSIKNSIAHSLAEQAETTSEVLPGEFTLPGVGESITASVKDVLKAIKE